MSNEGKTLSVLISGCSSGFGRSMVAAFLGRGWKVFATMRKADERGALFAEEQKRYGSALEILSLDVTSAAQRSAVAARVASSSPTGLDCLVNNAGYGQYGALEDLSEQQLREQFEVNFFGLALLTKAMLPALRQSRGRIINMSSLMGYSTFPMSSAYCASKFAVEGLSMSLRQELHAFGVQVCTVQPGAHRTDFGENMKLDSALASGAYAQATENFVALRRKLMGGAGVSPDKVVNKVLKLAERKRLPPAVRAGKDAGAAFWIQRLLPQSWAQGLLSATYRKALAKQGQVQAKQLNGGEQ